MPNISDIIRLYGLSAKKQLSQNFILDLNVAGKKIGRIDLLCRWHSTIFCCISSLLIIFFLCSGIFPSIMGLIKKIYTKYYIVLWCELYSLCALLIDHVQAKKFPRSAAIQFLYQESPMHIYHAKIVDSFTGQK